jgi:hypothetical protein
LNNFKKFKKEFQEFTFSKLISTEINSILEDLPSLFELLTLKHKEDSLKGQLIKSNQVVRKLLKENLDLKETLKIIPKGKDQIDFEVLKIKLGNMRKKIESKDNKIEEFFSTLQVTKPEDQKMENLILKKSLKDKNALIDQYKFKMKTLLKNRFKSIKDENVDKKITY